MTTKHSNRMENQVSRLGFDLWAQNIIVNAIENLGDNKQDYSEENAQVFVSLKFNKGMIVCAVRAYVPNHGWEFYETEVKA